MARRPPLPQALDELIAKLEPALAEAILDALQSMRDGVDYDALVEALQRNDIEGALQALDITPADFNRYSLERMHAYAEAGALESSYIPTDDANSVRFTFNMQNPAAERWIREKVGERITGYVAEQVETARAVIFDGYSRGEGPQQIAVDIAGRVDRASGRRLGGIIGLSEPQAGYADSMRRRLLSGDPVEMQKVLGRFDKQGKWIEGTGMTQRDRRYDALVKRHIAAGTPLSQEDVDKLAGRYSDRLLARRAEDIARTETQQSVFGARAESYRQALEREGLPTEALEKTWQHRGAGDDSRVQHIAMDDVTVRGLDTPFILPDRTAMQFAHDPAGGGKHNINCRCGTDFRILFGWRG